MENKIVLKIASKSNPNSIAGAIVGILKGNKKAELYAVGAGAVNQAVKAVAIARGFVASAGKELVCIPSFFAVTIEEQEKTGIKFIVREVK